jgi:hypothetical protein
MGHQLQHNAPEFFLINARSLCEGGLSRQNVAVPFPHFEAAETVLDTSTCGGINYRESGKPYTLKVLEE